MPNPEKPTNVCHGNHGKRDSWEAFRLLYTRLPSSARGVGEMRWKKGGVQKSHKSMSQIQRIVNSFTNLQQKKTTPRLEKGNCEISERLFCISSRRGQSHKLDRGWYNGNAAQPEYRGSESIPAQHRWEGGQVADASKWIGPGRNPIQKMKTPKGAVAQNTTPKRDKKPPIIIVGRGLIGNSGGEKELIVKYVWGEE